MIGVSVFKETKNPATFSGAGLKKTGFKLFSFALPASRPYQVGGQVLNNGCGYEAIRKNGNRGGTRLKSAGLQHHSVARQHCASKIHRNKHMSNELGVDVSTFVYHFACPPKLKRRRVLHFVFGSAGNPPTGLHNLPFILSSYPSPSHLPTFPLSRLRPFNPS
jgi:hypothetical protein